MIQHTIARRAMTLAAAILGVTALVAAPSFAAVGGTGHTVTETQHQHGTWTEPGDTDFCTGADITVTFTGNEVFHVTYFPGGDEVWGNFTEEGKVVVETGGLTYSGRVTIWGNFNVNERNANNTFTATVSLSATDANGVVHSEVGHEVAHIGWNAVSETPIVSFDKMFITCT